MSFLVKINHCPFGEPFVSEQNCTEITELSSEGLNYLQFCSLIGQTILHYGYATIQISYVRKCAEVNNSNH